MGTSMLVGEVLRKKGYGYIAVDPDATAYEALEMMSRKNVGAMPVLDDGVVIGMFSERDYARKVILHGRASKNTVVRELMTSPPVTVSPTTSVKDCMALMSEHHVRHLPVLKDGILIGVVSMRDTVNAIIADQETTITHLEKYISGT
ncbi:MAG TPA: CBS domain-containing protein [Nitrospirota bacterium]|nr:CBS domain-containing protein [Nitrospirota bacterium]